LKEAVKVLFASGSEDLIPAAIERMRAIYPEIPLEVVSEFPPEGAAWVPYNLRRGVGENLARCRAHFRGKRIRISAVILQPRMPYWRMRLVAFRLAPWNFLAFNEDLGHFMLRPRSLPTIARHMLWRTRNFVVWELSPGGATYTFLWRLLHPAAFRRPLLAMFARTGGLAALAVKRSLGPSTLPRAEALPDGVSVVIPSRNGKELLTRFLPEVARQTADIGGEVIIVDNGSSDGTVEFLRQSYPDVIVVEKPSPLSFARAVNLGIQAARFSHVCLLNNDMEIGENFFAALRAAFDRVPNLFCATAQIFFPAGARREETGKAVMPPQSKAADFPVRCDDPVEGEDLSYVLYGSGGCSLFATGKLRQLGGLDEIFEPAYVEDLDLGVRGWQQGWPTVFVADARVVHMHRATTSRYYTAQELDFALELNYLRFVARTADATTFRKLWRDAIRRLNLLAARQTPNPAALAALAQAWRAPFWIERRPRAKLSGEHILAIGSGLVSVFPGRSPRRKPIVLVASPYLPFPLSHGGAVRMYNLMRRAARDFDQVLVSFTDEPRPVPAEVLDICIEVVTVQRSGTHLLPSTGRPDVVEEFDSPAYHAALRQTVAKWKPAVAQLEFTQMAQYASDCAPARTILVEHDVTLDLYQQLLEQGEDWELRHQLDRWIPFETEAWRRVDRVVAMSEKDRKAITAGSAVSLANGVDLERFRPSVTAPDPRRVLFIGSFAHLPNVLAVEFFLREVWPLLRNAKLHIIAGARHQYFLDRYRDRAQVDLNRPGIEVEDFVSDVRPAYERAAVVVAPLLASAGTNIKIMEAMAMGKAIVSTRAGINGLDLDAGQDVIVADSGQEMAHAIQDLFEDPARRESLERRARETVERKYDWDAIAAQQKRLYEELAGLAPK
jgi:GT2 family glycosyltransferase/glycosyltransferase involved in cell wall biosynthesis